MDKIFQNGDRKLVTNPQRLIALLVSGYLIWMQLPSVIKRHATFHVPWVGYGVLLEFVFQPEGYVLKLGLVRYFSCYPRAS